MGIGPTLLCALTGLAFGLFGCSDDPASPPSLSAPTEEVTDDQASGPTDILTAGDEGSEDDTTDEKPTGPSTIETAAGDPAVLAGVYLSHVTTVAAPAIKITNLGSAGITPLLLPPELFIRDTLPSNFGMYIVKDGASADSTTYEFWSDYDLQQYRDGKFIKFPATTVGTYQFGYRSDNQPGGYVSQSIQVPFLEFAPETSTAANAAVTLNVTFEEDALLMDRVAIFRSSTPLAEGEEACSVTDSDVQFEVRPSEGNLSHSFGDQESLNIANEEYFYQVCIYNKQGQRIPWTLQTSATMSSSSIAINPSGGGTDPANVMADSSFEFLANLNVASPDYNNPAVALDFDSMTSNNCPDGYGIVVADDGLDQRFTCAPVPEPEKFFSEPAANALARNGQCNVGEIATGIRREPGSDQAVLSCRKVNPWLSSSALQDGLLAIHNQADPFLAKISGGYYNEALVNDTLVVLDDDFCHCPQGMFLFAINLSRAENDICNHVRCRLFSKP